MLSLNKIMPPHKGQKILYDGFSLLEADQVMILLHGRGASSESMKSLIPLIESERMAYIIPEANGNTWYPYRFTEKREMNEPGISSGQTLVHSIVLALNDHGFTNENIFFLGFSQGACLVADYTARHPQRFGGIFILSGGLIGSHFSAEDYGGDLKQTPVFLGCSDVDFHIPKERVLESALIFEQLNAQVTKKLYQGMDHTINQDELDVINRMISEPVPV